MTIVSAAAVLAVLHELFPSEGAFYTWALVIGAAAWLLGAGAIALLIAVHRRLGRVPFYVVLLFLGTPLFRPMFARSPADVPVIDVAIGAYVGLVLGAIFTMEFRRRPKPDSASSVVGEARRAPRGVLFDSLVGGLFVAAGVLVGAIIVLRATFA